MERRELRVDIPLGVDTTLRPDPESADIIEDMWWDPVGCWRQVGGYAEVADGGVVSSVRAMTWFSQHNGARRWLVWEDNAGRLQFFDTTKSSAVSIQTGRTVLEGSWQRAQFAAVGNWLWVINGHDEPIRWNGIRSQRVGFDRIPPPPRADDQTNWYELFDQFARTDNSGKTLILHWAGIDQRGVGDFPTSGQDTYFNYGYAYAWVNDLGQEGPVSPLSYASGVNINSLLPPNVGKKTIPVTIPDAPPWVKGIRLYRTRQLILDNVYDSSSTSRDVVKSRSLLDRGGNLFFHSEFATGKGFVYYDDKPDRELGARLDNDRGGIFPRGVKYLHMFKGTMFLAGSPEYPDRLFFSAPGRPEQYPPNNYLDVGSIDSGEVTGLAGTQNALVVFKRRGVYLVKGNPVRGFHIETLTEDVGCASPNALVEVPDQGLLFIAEEGVYILVGALENTGTPTRVRRISQPVQRIWDNRVNRSHLIGAQGIMHHNQKEVWLQVPADAEVVPHLGLVYHYEIGAWSIREGWPIGCFAESAERGYLFFGDHTASKVWVYSRGKDKNGVAVTAKYRTGWADFASVWGRTRVLHFQPYMLNYGNRTHSVLFRKDRQQTYQPAQPAKISADSESTRPVWGTAVWGTAVWTDYDPTVIRHDVPGTTGGPGLNCLEFQAEVSSTRIALASYAISVQPTKAVDRIKLSDAIAPVKR